MIGKLLNGLHRLKKKYAAKINLASIPIVNSIRKRIIFMMRKDFADNINGYKMRLDVVDSLALSWHHVFEPATTEFFRKNVKPGQTIVDLGANIGYFTLLFSGLVGEHGNVYAFEPGKMNAEILRENISINNIKNVIVIEKAVSDSIGKSFLFLNKINHGNHQIFNSRENRDQIEIETTTLDDYFFKSNIKIDWIKMDIEGAEFLALNGMKNILDKNRDLILVTEIFADGLNAAGSSVAEYIKALQVLNFNFEVIDVSQNKNVSISANDLIESFTTKRKDHPNVICRRKNLSK